MHPFLDTQRCHVGVVFALAIEADAFESRGRDILEIRPDGFLIREGTVADRRVAWVVGGTGIEQASAATQMLIDGHRPQFILSAGFAGALAAGIARGSVATASRVVRMNEEPLALMPYPAQAVDESWAEAASRPRSQSLTLATVDRVLCTAEEKKSVAQSLAAELVDMETWGVAKVALAAGLDCMSLRVVSDTASQTLPAEIAALARPQSAMRKFGTAIAAIGHRPRAAVDLWNLWEQAVVDGRTLADSIELLCRSLPA
jgi:adenosylhomocysteine nucleosidase